MRLSYLAVEIKGCAVCVHLNTQASLTSQFSVRRQTVCVFPAEETEGVCVCVCVCLKRCFPTLRALHYSDERGSEEGGDEKGGEIEEGGRRKERDLDKEQNTRVFPEGLVS